MSCASQPLAGSLPRLLLDTTYLSTVSADVSTTRAGPNLPGETYTAFRLSSTVSSDRSYLVVFATVLPSRWTSPCSRTADPVTSYVPMSMVVRLALPSSFQVSPSQPSDASPTPHMWATWISRDALFIPKSAMRELVPLNRMSFMSAWPFS